MQARAIAMIPTIARLCLWGIALVLLSPAVAAHAANKHWKNSVATGNWTNGNNWSAASPAGADNAGAPAAGDSVNIAPTDGNNHSITYDYAGPALALGFMAVDLTGAGATTTTFSMSGNTLTVQGMGVGQNGRGIVQQSGGTTNVAHTAFNPDLVIGDNAGSSGIYNLSGNAVLLVEGNEYIGQAGTGVLNQTGGTHTVDFSLHLGFSAGGMGTYNLSGGSATINSGVHVGGSGVGVLDVSGGAVLNAGLTFTIANTPASVANLSDGTINTFALNFNGAPSRFNWTGGTLHLGTSVTWDPNVSPTSTSSAFGPSLTLDANRTLIVTGNERLGGLGAFQLTLNSGSVHQVTGDLTVTQIGTLSVNSGSTLSYSSLTQQGGAVNGILQNPGNFVYQGGLFNARLVNQGTVNLGPSFVAHGGVENETSMAINTGQVLSALGPGLENKGTLTVAGGTINATALNLHPSPASFNWSSGTLNLATDVIWDSAAAPNTTGSAFGSQLILGSDRTLKISGDETLGGLGTFNLQLNADSTHIVTGKLTIDSNGTLTQHSGSTLNAPNIELAGGTILGDGFANVAMLTGHGTIVADGGFFNVGSITVSGGTLTVDNSSGNTNRGQIDIPAGQHLQLSSGVFENVGTINLRGGIIDGTSFFGNSTGIIGGHGTIANLSLNFGSLVVDSGILNVISPLANYGEVYLAGGLATLNGLSTLDNNGLLRGDGVVAIEVSNNNTGEIRAENGKRLKFVAAMGTSVGKVNLQGGTAEFSQPLTNGATGQIEGRGTLIVRGTGLTNNGHIALSSGITDVFGDVNNSTGSATRGITVSGNADVTFWDDVNNVAGSLFRVSAGSSATFFGTFSGAGITGTGDVYFEADISPGASPASVSFGGDVYFGTTANLATELGGTTLGSQFDHVEVGGAARLDGTLDVSLISGFSPGLGNSFEVLHADGGIFDEFNHIVLPALSLGLDWNVVYSNFSVLLEVVPSLSGDFNFDGTVDAADYVVWRKTDGAQGSYETWRTHFGETVGGGSGAGANATAPEPDMLVMLVVAAAGWCLRRRFPAS
jgi:hypothetical protein